MLINPLYIGSENIICETKQTIYKSQTSMKQLISSTSVTVETFFNYNWEGGGGWLYDMVLIKQIIIAHRYFFKQKYRVQCYIN